MCLTPLSIRTTDSFGVDINQSVPCGKCIECLKDYQNSWKIRLTEEARDHLHVYFFTLTYRDDVVPHIFHEGDQINIVSKTDLQKWLKRSRISLERLFKRDIDFKYFLCTEYGPNTGRPHAHGVLFTDISITYISKIFNDWSTRYGFVNFSEVGKSGKTNIRSSVSAVGNYCAKYCCKPATFNTPVEKRLLELMEQDIIPKTFKLMSKGLGQNYVNRMKRYHLPKGYMSNLGLDVVCDRAFYHDGAFKFKLPRFFRDRLYRKKFPCDTMIWNKKLKCYEKKTTYRYKSKNPLAIAMQVKIRDRVLAEYDKRFAQLRSVNSSASDSEIHIAVVRSEASARKTRQSEYYSKMSRFYNYNRFKNRNF